MVGVFLQFFCGLISSIIFKPIVYFFLQSRGAFPKDEDSLDRWTSNAIWLAGTCLCLITSFFVCLSKGFSIFFVLGCVGGVVFSITWWIVFLLTPYGRASLIFMRANTLETELQRRILSKNIGLIMSDEITEDIKHSRAYARKLIQDAVNAKTNKLSKRLLALVK